MVAMSTTTTTIANPATTKTSLLLNMATAATTLPQLASINNNESIGSTSSCPGCGFDLPSESNLIASSQAEAAQAAQARISELETQVRLLNQKAIAAVDRWADYEDEIARLRGLQQAKAQQQAAALPFQSQPPPQSPRRSAAATPETASPTRTSFLQSGTNRLSQLLSPRKSTPNLSEPSVSAPPTPTIIPPSSATALPPNNHTYQQQQQRQPGVLARPFLPKSVSDADQLIAALSREKSLRKEAEGKLTATSREVEELSVSLFEQANEMVATERRARAALEERVGELEKRDKEKGRRLERLEKAMSRIERVRALLEETETDAE